MVVDYFNVVDCKGEGIVPMPLSWCFSASGRGI